MIDVAMRINEIKRQHERWLRAQEVQNALTGDQRVDVVELGDLVLEVCVAVVIIIVPQRVLISRDHSFPQITEFRAEPRNLPVSAEFLCFPGMLRNLAFDTNNGIFWSFSGGRR